MALSAAHSALRGGPTGYILAWRVHSAHTLVADPQPSLSCFIHAKHKNPSTYKVSGSDLMGPSATTPIDSCLHPIRALRTGRERVQAESCVRLRAVLLLARVAVKALTHSLRRPLAVLGGALPLQGTWWQGASRSGTLLCQSTLLCVSKHASSSPGHWPHYTCVCHCLVASPSLPTCPPQPPTPITPPPPLTHTWTCGRCAGSR